MGKNCKSKLVNEFQLLQTIEKRISSFSTISFFVLWIWISPQYSSVGSNLVCRK